MSDEPALFPALPSLTAPPYQYADEHVLEPCLHCDGTGTVANPHPRGSARHWLWDPGCKRCNGVGKRLVFVGPVRDA
jgi:hypothetical protein